METRNEIQPLEIAPLFKSGIVQSRAVGPFRVTRVLEYSGPTHDPNFLFPGQNHARAFASQRSSLAPEHWVPAMNKLVITIQLWVVHVGGNIIVIDTGVGNGKPRGTPRMNMLNGLVLPWLEAAGASAEKVTHVIMTHLHPDHVGWNTVLSEGRWIPTFPNAQYLLPKPDFDYWGGKHETGDPSTGWFGDSVLPVFKEGLAGFIDDSREVGDCIAVQQTPGHTPGHVALWLRTQGESAVFCADIAHSPIQIAEPDWNTCYCLIPDLARATRRAFLSTAAQEEALIMPMHFGAPYCGYVRKQGNGFIYEPATWP